MVAEVKRRASGWHVHRFEVWSGELVCRVEALRMRDSLLLWVGAARDLGDVALGMAGAVGGTGGCSGGRGALATALLDGGGGGEAGVALARRLAAALQRPVVVCGALALDRFTAPLLERALVAEIKSRPDCF